MIEETVEVLVLGLGNVLCSDDGAGIEALNRLVKRFDLPEEVLALDGGTLGLSLLPWLQSARTVVILDAVAHESAPGTIVHLQGPDVGHTVRQRLSVHQIGVADLLDGAELLGGLPEQVILLGVVAESTELGVTLSEAVERSIDRLVDECVELIGGLGFRPRRREVKHDREDDRDVGDRNAGLDVQ